MFKFAPKEKEKKEEKRKRLICIKPLHIRTPWEDDITRNTFITDGVCYKVRIDWESMSAYAVLSPINFVMK